MHNNKRDAGKKDCPDELKGGRGEREGRHKLPQLETLYYYVHTYFLGSCRL